MQEKGTVLQTGEDEMTVCFERSSMCDKCGACERANAQMRMKVRREGDAQVGDRVQVQLAETSVIGAAMLAYGLPLAALFVGLFLGGALPGWLGLAGSKDLWMALCGLGLAGATFLILRLTEGKRQKKGRFQPQVVLVERHCEGSTTKEDER